MRISRDYAENKRKPFKNNLKKTSQFVFLIEVINKERVLIVKKHICYPWIKHERLISICKSEFIRTHAQFIKTFEYIAYFCGFF